MGDLNTVQMSNDQISGRTDATSKIWNSLCCDESLHEPKGANFYTYQHPTLPRQSRIDYITGPKNFMNEMCLCG